jgi:hypothetical protein
VAISAGCFACCSRAKLPPLYVLKGRDPNMGTTLGPHVPRARVTISDNCWMTERVMVQYLRWLQIVMGAGPFALVVDPFPGHVTQRVRWQARKMAVEFIPVPKGMTGQFQPVDRSCFEPLKNLSEPLWHRRYAEEPGRNRPIQRVRVV